MSFTLDKVVLSKTWKKLEHYPNASLYYSDFSTSPAIGTCPNYHYNFNAALEQRQVELKMKILKMFLECLTFFKFMRGVWWLAAGTDTGKLFLHAQKYFVEPVVIRDEETRCRSVTFIAQRPGNNERRIAVVYKNGLLKFWDIDKRKCVNTVQEDRSMYGIKFLKHNKKFVTYGSTNTLVLYDEYKKCVDRLFTSDQRRELAFNGHSSAVLSVCFHPKNPHEFVSSGWDRTIQFWDLRTQYAVRSIVISGQMMGDCLDIDPRGREIFSGAEQHMQIWDYRQGKLLMTLEPDIHQPLLTYGKWLKKDSLVVSGVKPTVFMKIARHSGAADVVVCGLKHDIRCIDVDYKTGAVAFCSGNIAYEIAP